MKVTRAILLRPIPELGTSSVSAANGFDLDFEAGLLTVKRRERVEEDFVIPVSQISYMRAEAPKTKK